jgi:thiol:disulfide interchange protein DsbD
MTRILLAFFATCLAALACAAKPVKTPHVEAELIAEQTSFRPGETTSVALQLTIIDKWHTYWRNPGDSGLPTKLTWNLPTGFAAGEVRWPAPKTLPLGPLTNYGYEGRVLHLVSIATPASWPTGKPAKLAAKAEWLVCHEVCIPESADLTLELVASPEPPAVDARWAAAFKSARAELPVSVSSFADATIRQGRLLVALAEPPEGRLHFFPYQGDLIAHAGPQELRLAGGRHVLEIPLQEGAKVDAGSIDGVLVADRGWATRAGRALEVSIPVRTAEDGAALATDLDGGQGALGLWAAVGYGILGGLLLNLMPCVFPVIGIKVLGFAAHAGSRRVHLVGQGLLFLAGVLVSFAALAGAMLAIRAGGSAIGWGFQLQSPGFVVGLAFLFFLMGLNLSGVFEFGATLQRFSGSLGSQTNGPFGSFLTGVLATVVATPCTAPFMGAALGFTIHQPPWIMLSVFLSVGFGMALPVVALCAFPGWLARLPKPGVWMEWIKQLLAFPLYATVAWLAWVLGSQAGNDGVGWLLLGLVVAAGGAWLNGRIQGRRPGLALAAGACAVALGLGLAWPRAEHTPSPVNNAPLGKAEGDWAPFSMDAVAAARAAGVPVFIDFTASWCITCQVNKRVALTRAEVEARFKQLGVARFRADWSRRDPEITRALASYGRNGVPLYVYFPAGQSARILPEALTPGIVLEALNKDGIRQ